MEFCEKLKKWLDSYPSRIPTETEFVNWVEAKPKKSVRPLPAYKQMDIFFKTEMKKKWHFH